MGTIKKTKSGNFQANAYDVKGIRHRNTFKKHVEAQAFINKIEAVKYDRKLVGAKMKNARITFDQALEDYLLTKASLKPKTIVKYDFAIRQFRAFLASLKIVYIDQFTADHGSLLYKLLVQEKTDINNPPENPIKAKPKTVNHFLQIIRSFFNLEVEKGHIDRSPLLHIKSLKEAKPKPEYYTEKELGSFFAQEMPEAYRNAFTALLHTGMRINELTTLTWEDVDMKRRFIYVRSKEGFSTKTDNSERTIPINDTLQAVIKKIAADPTSEVYPFCSITGNKLSDRRLLEACKEVGKSANIRGRVFLHKFRHTFATHLVKRRVPIEAVQKLLGHASILETMVYAHVRSEDLHPDVALLNNLVTTDGRSDKGPQHIDSKDSAPKVFDILSRKAA